MGCAGTCEGTRDTTSAHAMSSMQLNNNSTAPSDVRHQNGREEVGEMPDMADMGEMPDTDHLTTVENAEEMGQMNGANWTGTSVAADTTDELETLNTMDDSDDLDAYGDLDSLDDMPDMSDMQRLLDEQETQFRTLKRGDVVEGQIVRIDQDEILVDIGLKSEGVLSTKELPPQ